MTENFEEHLKTSLSHAYNIEGELGGGGNGNQYVPAAAAADTAADVGTGTDDDIPF